MEEMMEWPFYNVAGVFGTAPVFSERPAILLRAAITGLDLMQEAGGGVGPHAVIAYVARDWHRILPSSRALGHFLLPSFVADLLSAEHKRPIHTNSAAALDGLRGLACLFVFNEHVSYHISPTFLRPYGHDGLDHFILLPFIRIFWSGFAMVAIFFAISGYVLSIKSLKQMHAGDMLSFNKTITSSVIRRGLRLYLPTTAAIMMTGFMAWLGCFNHSIRIWATRPDLHLHEKPVYAFATLSAQMRDAWRHAWGLTNVWNFDSEITPGDYDLHLWTIPVEFRSSIILFVILIGVARLRGPFRVATEFLVLLYATIANRREVLVFVGGMLLADLDLFVATIQAEYTAEQSAMTLLPLPCETCTLEKARNWARYTAENKVDGNVREVLGMVTGLYLCSAAVENTEAQAGYATLVRLSTHITDINPGHFLRAIGALLVTAAAANSTLLSPVFTNRFSMYLGQISYALYIVHGNVIKIVEYAMLPKLYSALCRGAANADGCTSNQLGLVWLAVMVVVLPITLWAADVFWRVIDVPSVRFARWFEERICRR